VLPTSYVRNFNVARDHGRALKTVRHVMTTV
jgi:hypothetical protein